MKDSNVVPFPKQFSPRAAAGGEEPEKVHAQKQQQHHATLVGKIRRAADDPKEKFARRHDEVYVAQFVDRLLAEAKSRGIARRHISERSRENGGDGHLERLHVKHTLPLGQAKDTASKKLVRKIKPYVVLLDLLADLLERPRDQVLIEAFRDTSFCQPIEFSIEEPASRLSWLLHEMCDWIVREADLQRYFREIRKVRGGYDPTTDQIVFGGIGPARAHPARGNERDGSDNDYGYDDYIGVSEPPYPPLPGVPLLRIPRCTLGASLEIEKAPLAPCDASREEVAALCRLGGAETAEQRRLGPNDLQDVEIDISTEVCLGLGPRTSIRDIGPLFEVRSHVELWVGDHQCQLTFDRSSFPLAARGDVEDGEIAHFAGTVAAQFEDGWRRVAHLGRLELLEGRRLRQRRSHEELSLRRRFGSPIVDDDIFANSFGVTVDGGFSFDALIGERDTAEFGIYWMRLSSETVNRLMQLLTVLPDHRRRLVGCGRDPGPWRWLCDLDGPQDPGADFHYSDAECRRFERALYSGALEQALLMECRRMQDKLSECQERTEAALRRRDATLLSRWRQQNDAKSD